MTDYKELVERLQAPAFWFSESAEGHPGENTAPREAATVITDLQGKLEAAERELHEVEEVNKNFTDQYAKDSADISRLKALLAEAEMWLSPFVPKELREKINAEK